VGHVNDPPDFAMQRSAVVPEAEVASLRLDPRTDSILGTSVASLHLETLLQHYLHPVHPSPPIYYLQSRVRSAEVPLRLAKPSVIHMGAIAR
jgi:hypothetical protein